MFDAQTQGELDLGDPVLGESTVDTNEQVQAAQDALDAEAESDAETSIDTISDEEDGVLLEMDDFYRSGTASVHDGCSRAGEQHA